MKKILCMILTIALVCSAAALASEPTQNQLDDLKRYGIMEGDPDGALRLEDGIKRSEAVKIICTMLCHKPQEYAVSSFPDIAPGHWATPWIDAAHALGLVEGDDNGLFRPNDPVTNEEFIKMLVVSLGYEPMADAKGGFPAGYVAAAARCGITDGFQLAVNAPAKRGDIAVMTARALDVPVMVQTGFGAQVEYRVLDGKDGYDYRTLRHELDPESKNEAPLSEENITDSSGVPHFNGDKYQGRLVEITNFTGIGKGVYEFNDKKLGDDITFKVNKDTYVYINENTIPLSAAKDGCFAQIWYENSDKAVIDVLKIELMEFAPSGAR